MANRSEQEKEKLTTRVKNWGVNRVLPRGVSSYAKHNLVRSTHVAAEALKPNVIDRDEILSGYNGRYSDGGRARFATMAHERGLDDNAIDELRIQRTHAAIIYGVSGIFGFLFGIYMMFTEQDLHLIFSGAGASVAGMTVIALAVRNDFTAWQLSQRRFGGFREYLESRL